MFSSSSYDRFSGRVHGHGYGSYSAARRGSVQETPRSLSPLIGPVLTTIYYSELEADQALSSDAIIIGLEDIVSYN